MYETLLNLDPVIQGLAGVLAPILLGYVGKRIKVDILQRAVTAFPHIVAEVYQTYVKALKAARPDGLTPDEKKQAMKMALDRFKALLFLPKLWAYLFGGQTKFDAVLTSFAEGSLNAVKAANRTVEVFTGNPTGKAPEGS